MKRSKFGVGLLVALLILGALSTWAMLRCTQPVAQMMEQAREAALREDWEEAETAAEEARSQWDRNFPLCASLTDHGPMESVNGLFAQLEIYAGSRDVQNFAAVCALLSRDVEAIGEAHSLKWWNLL